MPELHEIVDTLAREFGFTGAVQVDLHDRVLVSAAFGLADRTHRVPNTAETRFGTASGTKLFTALAVGALIDDGRCALDSRLHDLATFDLAGVSREVTIGHLLTHTSGVYDYYDEDLIDDFDNFELAIPPYKLLKPSDYLPMVVAGEQKFAPGTRFAYSNGGYVLLGMLIEQLCGSYHSFVEERVMARARMASSGFFRLDQLPERTATGYRQVGGRWRSNIYVLPVIGGPDGGAFVTTGDMRRLWRALLSGHLLSPALTGTFLAKTAHRQGHEYYGHGVWIDDDGEQPPIISVVGSDAGVSFSSACHGSDLVATVASNASQDAWPMAKAIKQYVLAEFSAEQRSFRDQ